MDLQSKARDGSIRSQKKKEKNLITIRSQQNRKLEVKMLGTIISNEKTKEKNWERRFAMHTAWLPRHRKKKKNRENLIAIRHTLFTSLALPVKPSPSERTTARIAPRKKQSPHLSRPNGSRRDHRRKKQSNARASPASKSSSRIRKRGRHRDRERETERSKGRTRQTTEFGGLMRVGGDRLIFN